MVFAVVWVCFSPRKNTVNNSNFAVFSCFSLFFELRWSAIHGYQILRGFFSDNQYFRMFLVSMADIIGSYERLPNDAVRAVAVAKRREYKVKRYYRGVLQIAKFRQLVGKGYGTTC